MRHLKQSKKIFSVTMLAMSLILACDIVVTLVDAQPTQQSGESRMSASQSDDHLASSTYKPWVIEKLLRLMSGGRGFITRSKLEKTLEIKLVTTSDGKGGYVSTFDGDKNGRLSLELHEHNEAIKRAMWKDAQAQMGGAYSVLNVAFGGACYVLNNAKNDLRGVGLNQMGEIGLQGVVVAQFAEENGYTRAKLYYTIGPDHIAPCVQSVRIEGIRVDGATGR